MSEIETLVQLQSVDLDLDEKKRRLEQIRASLGESDELRAARQAVESARARLHDLEARQRQLEWEVSDRATKIGEIEKKLYSGTVRNPKELSGLQTEVEHLKDALSEVEERGLEVIDQADAARSDVVRLEEALRATQASWESEQAALREEQAGLDAAVRSLQERRASVAATVSAQILPRYEELRRTRRGVAVAKIDRNMCLGCRTTLATSEVQSARLGKIATCSSCGRILQSVR